MSITISGVPSDATLSAGTKNSNGTWTLTPAQLSGLSLKAGEVTTANLTITATNTEGTTASATKSIALTINPVAPGLTAPTSLAVNADASVALNISEMPFDSRDTISITISGVPSDASLSAGAKNANGTWTLTSAQLSGLTLNAGNATVTTLTVTATNTQGATASTSDTIALTVNPTLALSVSVVGNATVQQGQTLVATATVGGDPADAGATINYQWQSSSDGGQTWTNAGAGVPGNFNNGQLSSFLQLTEVDEGLQFRAVASFTDSANNVISTSSTPTVPVADVTPEITVPFSYTVSDLSIVKTVSGTPTQIYDDNFSQAPIASPTILSNGSPSPIVFITNGSTWSTSGGGAVLSSTGVAPNGNIAGGNSVFDIAVLNTNTDPTSTLGLKQSTTFTVSSTFNLTTPPTGGYGMELTDGTSTHGVDQLERLIVQNVGGNAVVELIQANLTTNTQTVVASQTLTAAQLANNNQIEFQMSHSAGTTAVSGTFELIDNGVVTSTTNFAPTATAFTNGIDWTRVDVGAFTSAGIGLNVDAGQTVKEGQTLTASATTNDSDATINYQWQSSADGGQTWTNIAGAANSSSYVAQQSDENHEIGVVATTSDPDNPQSATVTSVATGSVIDNATLSVSTSIVGNGPVQEGQILVTSSTTTGDPSDLTAPVTYQWQTSSDGGASWTNVAATTTGGFNNELSSFYQLAEQDEGNLFRVQASLTDATGQVVTATSTPTVPVADISPIITQPWSFALDEFKVSKGANTFDDTFTQGPPPVGGLFGSNLTAFSTNNGSIIPEVNGKAILTATGSTPNATLASTDSTGAELLTNTAPEGSGPGQSELGLKEDAAWKMSATYDFALPGLAVYGIELLNGAGSLPNNEVVQLTVESGVNPAGAEVALYETNLVTGVHTQLTKTVLTAAQIANTSKIELDLAHNTAGSQAIIGSFELFDGNGNQIGGNTFGATGTEFDSSTSVRAGVFASSSPSVGITGTAQEGQTLAAVAVTNDADATINYQWQESSNGTTWTNIGTNSSTYVLQESDVGSFIRVVGTTSDQDNPQSATATSQATGAVAAVAPTLNLAAYSLSVNEDGSVALGISETPFNPSDTVSITITGVPGDAALSAGTNNGGGNWSLTPAQLSGLSLVAGEVTTANLTVTATNTAGATASSSQSIALTVNPVAPGLTAPTSLAVNADASVALNISEMPFDSRDTVSITISGVPSDATLSAGTNNGNGSWSSDFPLSFPA